MPIGNLLSNLSPVTGRPVTNRKKQKMTTFKINYQKLGSNEAEEYRNVSVVGYYGSKDCVNLGMTVLVPERKWEKDPGVRRMDYMGIQSMEVEVAR